MSRVWRALRGRLHRAGGADDGQVIVLTFGVVVFASMLILVVASAAQLHLEHKRLVALADMLALDASDSIGENVYYGHEGKARLALTDGSVRGAVDDYLAAHPDETAGWRQFAVSEAVAAGPRTARVGLVARVRPSSTAWVLSAWTDGITIHAEASATAD
ncbi:pilus assembly protein TadG-related protein [Cellulomonas sp. CW35]|uniref:Uncharacterized protein n=1 Tax=Cellulomonas uda TaxID=1714 RepID=A0A4Y3KEQ0_CELUD|nr:hypothetical protein [Cellulomonas uda]NII66858.1 hypothetical protein [Cellulomonas uda]GEA82126.1 hypothetical protein CUD01_25700 [Cellulomonas uda]